MTFLLFLLGNLQEFLDTTQLLLLRIAGISSFLYVVFGLYSAVIALVQSIRRQRVRFYRSLLNAFGLVVSGGILFLSYFLQSWIEQVR